MRRIHVKTMVSIIGIMMIFSVVMCAFIFFYQQAISKGIPVIVSEHQFHQDYFGEFGNTLIQKE